MFFNNVQQDELNQTVGHQQIFFSFSVVRLLVEKEKLTNFINNYC